MSLIIKVKTGMKAFGLKNLHCIKMCVIGSFDILDNFDGLVLPDGLDLHSNLDILVSQFCGRQVLVSYHPNRSLHELSE